MNPMKLALTYLRIGVLNEMQYRINFFIQLLQSFISVATGLIGLSLVFGQVNTLAGWSRPELLAVMGVHLLMGGVIRSIIQPNMERLMDDVRNGTLREFRFWQLVDVIVGMVVIGIAFIQLKGTLGILQLLGFLAALIMGGIMLYCVWLMVTSISFWVIRVQEISNLFEGLYAAGRWPVGIYPDWLRTGLTFLVPVAFAVTVPAEALTNRLSGTSLLFALGMTLFFILLSRGLWRLGLNNYSGASS
jgi:ABC-2 type transport system permease protein